MVILYGEKKKGGGGGGGYQHIQFKNFGRILDLNSIAKVQTGIISQFYFKTIKLFPLKKKKKFLTFI